MLWFLLAARDELMNLKDALGMGDERDDLVDMAATFFKVCLVYICFENINLLENFYVTPS